MSNAKVRTDFRTLNYSEDKGYSTIWLSGQIHQEGALFIEIIELVI